MSEGPSTSLQMMGFEPIFGPHKCVLSLSLEDVATNRILLSLLNRWKKEDKRIIHLRVLLALHIPTNNPMGNYVSACFGVDAFPVARPAHKRVSENLRLPVQLVMRHDSQM